MNQISNVSTQAFLQELQNWDLTLTRQIKKLKQIKKISNNKLQINTIDITLLAIESELIQYKKIKDKKMVNNSAIVEQYNTLSKRFMNLIEKIGQATQSQKYQNSTINQDKNVTEQNSPLGKPKHFLEQTFTYNMSKQPSKKKTHSVFQTKKQLNNLMKENSRRKNSVKGGKTCVLDSRKSRKITKNLTKLQLEEDEDLSDIRYQLKEIKSMIVQMDKQIKLHNHEDIEREMSKIAHNNKKLSIEVKAVKDDNQFLLARMQTLKQEINNEKTIQNNMIKQFEQGKSNNKMTVNELSKQMYPNQEVSQWVKDRL